MLRADAPLWHTLPPDDAIAATDSDGLQGLSSDEVTRRSAVFGPNSLPEARQRSLLSLFFRQFASPLIYLLLAAAVVAVFIGEKSDPIVIVVVVVLNAVIGAFQEGRAERSLRALRQLATQKAQVVRAGQAQVVEAQALVPGDIVLLAAGDAVPADARLVEGAALQLAEAALTGESLPVSKDVSPLQAETPLGDRRNMVYAGTQVTAGRARGLVVATGLATEIGHIAAMAEGQARPPKTPLERRTDQFGRALLWAALVMFALVLLVGFLRGLPMGEVVMIGISQLVGMIPEGLPVAMTIALAVGVQRMARRRAVVRRLSAVETLGSTTVICTDKTGTLTANEMTVTAVHLPGQRFTVSGSGYAPSGTFLRDGVKADPTPLRPLFTAAVLCNDAQLVPPDASAPRWRPVGDPTEVALLTAARKAGLDPEDLRQRHPRRGELPFDAGAKMMATQHDGTVFIKGAPEEVLKLCRPLEEARALGAAAQELAGQALRVLAIARAEGVTLDPAAGFPALAGKATVLGLVGQMDPPRAEVAAAVAACRAAGIRPVMVTGDHKATGFAIARTLGIAGDDEDAGAVAVDGAELGALDDAALDARLATLAVFARVHPAQKLRIVERYQRQGAIVAMTGDGVNDAPALVQANVGVAMGVTGTDVAKQAAKIVVTDDNFATIVAAVEEGRVVYRNIKKAVLLLFSTSMAEVAVLLLALLFGLPPPFAAVQILWNNLVTEGVITINLVMEPPEGDEMRRPPVPPDEPLLSRAVLTRMALMTPTIVLVTLGWFALRLGAGVPLVEARSETFALLAICEWFNVLNCRSERHSALTFDLLRNRWLVGGLVLGNLLQAAVIFLPPLNSVFHTAPFGLSTALALGAVGSLVLWVEEVRKLIARRR